MVLPDATDLGYAPPVYAPSDDGLTFPLSRQDIVLVDVFHQGEDIAYKALDSMAAAAQSSSKPPDQMPKVEWLHQQQHEQAILVIMQLAIASFVALATDLVQPPQHGKQQIEIFQPLKIAFANLFALRHILLLSAWQVLS